LSGADDHLRLIKSALKATFPNFTDAALNSTQTQIDAVAALLVGGVLRANGAAFPGMIADHGGTTAPTGWLACDGQAVSRTTYADLFAAIGTTWGAGDGSTTFNVPNLAIRYRRHRDNSTVAGAVGTLQNPQNLSHTHTGSGTTSSVSNDHTHTFSGSTGGMSANAVHSHSYTAPQLGPGTGTSPNYFFSGAGQAATTSAVNIDHSHAFSGTTGGISANHTHTYAFTSSAGSADGTEARPYSATVLSCIKT
jgi:microcystin-dependent protein